jgi:hypothetical protein
MASGELNRVIYAVYPTRTGLEVSKTGLEISRRFRENQFLLRIGRLSLE